MVDTVGQIWDDYKLIVKDVSTTCFEYIRDSPGNYSYPWDFVKDLRQYTRISAQDGLVAVGLAFILTCLRAGLAAYIFKPMARWLRLTAVNEEKFPESAWKCLYYTGTWSYTVYLLFFCGKYNFFFKTEEIWSDWSVGMEIPLDICVLYMVQLGFYIHSIYGSIYMDQWRKDSHVMIFHHVISCILLTFSFAVRYYKIGVLVLFLHDIADVCLEFSKCNVYMKDRGGKYHALNDHLSTIGFLCFTSVWYWFRLYWYPIKVMYTAGHVSRLQSADLPFYLVFNILLLVILVLNLYWWMFILSFLYRVATGQMKEVDDIREEEVVQKLKPDLSGDSQKHQANGTANSAAVTNGTKHRGKKDQ